MEEYLIYFAIGFLAQVIDGALGMAYGLTTTSMLLSFGVPAVNASAITHMAECVTTFFSAVSHHQFGNIDKRLFFRLLVPGLIGSILGVFVLTQVDNHIIKPIIAIYLLIMGATVLLKAFVVFPPREVSRHMIPLGLGGGFMDAVGGGGWGPIVTSTLLANGQNPRMTIGSVNAVEFFVAMTASIAFFLNEIVVGWEIILALALGGAIAAPFGAFLCKHIPFKVLLLLTGTLIIALSLRVIWMTVMPIIGPLYP